jgi:hypoxanthine phosphoribosyltransferase
MNKVEYLNVSYEELDKMVESLYMKLEKDNFIPDSMVAVARGGWFPARVLSDIFNSKGIPVDIISVTTKFYTNIGKRARRPVLLQELHQSLFDQTILIVDDVSDTGHTLKFIEGYINWLGAKEVKIATVFMKPDTVSVPHYFEESVSQDTWIVFPYEVREFKALSNK